MEESLFLLRDLLELWKTIFKHMTTISKNICFDVLDDIVDEYNNAVYRTIKMKPIGITDDSYVEYNENSNKTDLKF